MSRKSISREQAAADEGTHVSIEQLRQLRRDALRLSAAPADAVGSLFPGAYRALFHGRGIEFDETRNYQWGDDYRTLDWRVTARTGQMHTKLFHEERERTLYLVLDVGPTMQFGSRVQLKWVLAARIAALFAWLAAACGDRVGISLFGDASRAHFRPPAGGEPGVLKIFHLLTGLQFDEPGGKSDLSDALLHLRRQARPGSLILLLSDFISLDSNAKRHLAHLGRHNALAAIRITDPLEAELPPSGIYPITDGVGEALLDSSAVALRDDYRLEFSRRQEELQAAFRQYGARFITMSTHLELVEALREGLLPSAIQPRQGQKRGRRDGRRA